MRDRKPADADEMWREWFTVSSALRDHRRARRILNLLPTNPRCKVCKAPFAGVGGSMVRLLLHKEPSGLNPLICNACENAARQFPGGAEVEMSILFADIRGSTALAEKMTPTEYSRLISRFYTAGTRVIVEADGLVEKLAGDELVAFWGAGFAGPEYVRRTVDVARDLMRVMMTEEIPLGVGVHWGTAYFGSLKTAEGLSDISAKGEAVNITARLCAKAAPGEIILSEAAIRAAAMDASGLESRTLELKGLKEPVQVRVMRASK